MTKYITIGYDGSPESTEALTWAADEAVARGCRLEIVSAYRIPVAGDIHTGWIPTEAYTGMAESARTQLDEAARAITERYPTVGLTTRLAAGPAGPALVENPDGDQELIVVGASSHRGAAAFWLGSTSRSVVRQATCPVVIVRGPTSRGRPDRIVAAVDGSEPSTKALNWAAAEADLHGVPLLVVHAWDYPYPVAESAPSQMRDLTQVDAALVLDAAVESAREQCGVDVEGQLVEGSPASAVLGAVRDGDLLVLGSRGRGALRASVFGSTVNSVLDAAVIPVAVVR